MAAFEFLGPYRLGRQIGRGGMGTVYEAVHDTSGQRVAVKLISSTVAEDIKFRRRFAGEVETLKRLRHPGIVQLIGYGEEQGHLFYSMELVEGESLQQRIRQQKRIDWLPALEIAIQVSAALKHAHDIGVIHRDLKPANLLITEDGTVKLVDFGIAKIFGYGDETVVGSVLGTADYMAPEQAGTGSITPRTDLYALGSVLYAMLAGRPPFSGKRLTQVIESLKRDRPVPLELVNPELPAEVVELVHQLLEKNPEDRPPTALAVLKRCQAMRAGLQRGQTLEMDTSHTVLANEQSAPEDPTIERNGPLDADTGTGLSGDDATDAGRPPTHASVVRRGGVGESAATRSAAGSKDEATVVSGPAAVSDSQQGSETGDSQPQRTHFQAVDPSRDARGLVGAEEEEGSFNWAHAASVAGLVLVLLGGLAVIAYAVRGPGPDQLYRSIQTAEQEGDVLAAESAIRRFLADYPDDERAGEVSQLEQSLNLDRFLRRLQAKANRAGGLDQLDPMEQSFLEAMESRSRRPDKAEQHLAAWLAVYAPPGESQAQTDQRMIELAQRELKRLAERDNVSIDDRRVRRLTDRINWAKQNLEPEPRQRLLQGLVDLFADEEWASSAVDQARDQLSRLGAAGDAESE